MRGKYSFSKGRLIAFICCALLPIAAMGLGVWQLIRGVVFTPAVAITYFLIPLITVGLLATHIFCLRKTWLKIISSAAILLLLPVAFLFSVIFTGHTQIKHYQGAEARAYYASVKSEYTLMPELTEVGRPLDIECYNVFSSAIFSDKADYLICRYTPDEYETQKAELERKYIFQTEPIIHSDGKCEPMADIDGYQFRLLSIKEHKKGLYYPKRIILIGCSDEKLKIVYIAFENLDLDYIPSLKEFIIHSCGWKYIR